MFYNCLSYSLTSVQYADNKSFCEDLTEGKFSFPIIHSIKRFAALLLLTDSLTHCPYSDQTNTAVINIVRQRTSDYDLKKLCVAYMVKTGSFAYTVCLLVACISAFLIYNQRAVMRDLEQQALDEIKKLGGNEPLVCSIPYCTIQYFWILR